MWPTDGSKDKGDGSTGAGPKFLVGMDGRPVRFPMTDEIFEEFRRRLLDAPGSDVVSVSRFDEKTVQIITRGAGAASPATMQLIGALVLEFSIGNPIAIKPEPR
jgi:hypothetical protein